MQDAPLQDVAPAQEAPQAPQFAESLERSTQARLQLVRPVAQLVLHAPLLHTSPPPQACPQAPQLSGALEVSPHVPAHAGCPARQTQLPQPPQFATSLMTSTQARSQDVSPALQLPAHCPALHTSVTAHALPHDPQSVGLFATSMHAPAQRSSPAAQMPPPAPAPPPDPPWPPAPPCI
jgi:hypothetical protein